MTPLLGHSITYRIAVGSQAGRKVFTLQTLPTSGDPFGDGIGKVAGSSLHAGVAARPGEGRSLNRWGGNLSGRGEPGSRRWLNGGGTGRYKLKRRYRAGTTRAILDPW